MNKPVLDVCCGSRMMWFNKQNSQVVFGDKRNESHILCDGRALEITPDIELDFTKLPFYDNSFSLVVFDPPHLVRAGKNGWLAKKYGVLGQNWKDEISAGFAECFRVLKPNGTLIFKWNENQIKVSDVVALAPQQPLFGHRTSRQTLWFTFLKVTI